MRSTTRNFSKKILGDFSLKIKSYLERYKKPRNSSKRILVLNDGRTGDFPLKIRSYLERYTKLIELKDLRDFQPGELEVEIRNYDKTILICKVGFRMRLNQEEMIRDLDRQIQNDLQVFYLLKQGAGSYDIADFQAWQVNVFMHEINEKSIEESLEDFVYATRVRGWKRLLMPMLFLTLLTIASVCSILQLNSALEGFQICQNLEGEFWQISQDYIDLTQAHKRLFEENLEIQQEQKYCVQNGDFMKGHEELQKLILRRGNQSQKGCGEIRNEYDQLLKSYKALEKEHSDLKERFAKERQQYEDSKKKLVAHISGFEREMLEILKEKNVCEEKLRNAEQRKEMRNKFYSMNMINTSRH